MDFYRTLNSPISVQVELTSHCDLRCTHCYNARMTHTDETESLKHIERIAEQLAQSRVTQVTITGGEPLLRKRDLKALLAQLHQYGIETTVNSNLTALTTDYAKSLVSIGLKAVLTSVFSYDPETHDAITQKPGSWGLTMRGISNALSTGLWVSVNMVATELNKTHIFETARLLQSMGVKSFNVTKAAPPVGMDYDVFQTLTLNREELVTATDELLRAGSELGIEVDLLECYPLCAFPNDAKYTKVTKHGCTAGVTSCTIGANGEVRACSHAHQEYGSIYNESLSDIWAKMAEWRTGELLPEKCRECAYLKKCTGGCRMEAFCAGSISGMDPLAQEFETLETLVSGKSAVTASLEDTTLLKLAENLATREEPFGCVTWVQPFAVYLVTSATGQLFKSLSGRSFSVGELKKEHNDKTDFLNLFFTALINIGFVHRLD